MTKNEIIESTLKSMQGRWESAEPALHDDNDSSGRYVFIVIRTLSERLLGTEYSTCSDFAHLGVECCDTCHSLYPHYEMNIEDLPGGGKAGICCSILRALHGEKPTSDKVDFDLEEALGGGIRQTRENCEGFDESDSR